MNRAVAAVSTGILLLLAPAARSATWYVSTSGHDTDTSGSTEQQPLRTLFAALQKCSAGDRIALKRGDVFYDQSDNSKPAYEVVKGVTIEAYGDGSKPRPVISGGVRIDSWQPHGNGIYVANVPDAVGMLYVNGQLATIARYPNSGWLRVTDASRNGDGWISCDALKSHSRNAAGYWKGATLRHRVWSWYYMIYDVQSYDASGKLHVNRKPHYTDPGWGFYLENGLSELDTANEWWCDEANKRVYLKPPEGISITDARIEGSVFIGPHRSMGMVVKAAGTTLRELCFRHYRDAAVLLDAKTTIEHCTFEQCGGHKDIGVIRGWVKPLRGSVIRNCMFRDILERAVSWLEDTTTTSGPATTIVQDTFVNIMNVPGYGSQASKNWSNSAVVVWRAKDMVVRENIFDTIGYAGVIFGTGGNTVEYNYFKNNMFTLNDGGAIYWNCGDLTVRNNIVVDTKGDMVSVGPSRSHNISHGIWPEFLGGWKNNVIENNTVIGSGGTGLFLPRNFNATVRHNVFFDNKDQQMLLSGQNKDRDMHMNHTIKHNVMFSNSPKAGALMYILNKDHTYTYGTIDNNWYCTAGSSTPITEWYSWGSKKKPITLDEWKSRVNWADRNPNTSPIARPANATEDDSTGLGCVFYNPTMQTKSFSVSAGAFVDIDGNAVEGSMSLEPFQSKVLVRTGAEGAAVGIDRARQPTCAVRPGALQGGYRFTVGATPGRTVVIAIYDLQGKKAVALRGEANAEGRAVIELEKALSAGKYVALIMAGNRTPRLLHFVAR